MKPTLAGSQLRGDLHAATHPLDHDVGKPALLTDDYLTWQKINRSIEAAKQRHINEHARNRHVTGIGR